VPDLVIEGLELLSGSIHADNRGSFRRIYDSATIKDDYALTKAQINLSINPKKGTLRGMHYQATGLPEHKTVSIVSGEVYLVVVDLREDSTTYLFQHAQVMNSNINQTLFVPAGCATGWLSLQDNVVLHYLMFSRFEDNTYSGFRWNDPFFNIEWPEAPSTISIQDGSWPEYKLHT
jgi:dTDP-4-dehydrorhamnose 3,5-epimerase